MLTLVIIFILQLIILFFVTRSFTKNLFLLFYFFSPNKQQAIQLLTWFLLPGTIIHELAHLLTAEVLRVSTGQLSFTPEIKEEKQVKAGGLKIAKTDPLRHALIGLAPLIFGITLITVISHLYLFPKVLLILQPTYKLTGEDFFLLFIFSYLVFIISNTMFSSKKDLATIIFPVLIIGLLIAFCWWLGIKISLSSQSASFLNQLGQNLNLALGGTMAIDFLFLILVKILFKLKRTSHFCYY